MPLEAILLKSLHQRSHPLTFKDVLWKDVFIRRVAGTAVYEEILSLVMTSRQLAEKIPTPVVLLCVRGINLQLVASPVDCPQGDRVKTARVKKSCLVVVAENRQRARFHDFIETSHGVRTVADNVTKADDLVDTQPSDVVERGR